MTYLKLSENPLARKNLVILILGLLCTIGPFSIDMYLPGFPAIAKSLGVSVDLVSYSLSSYFVGICIGQIISGPMLDRFGRKIPLIVGLVIYILASIFCANANSIEMLVVGRFFQALGGCLGIVAPRAMIRDLFPQNEVARVLSLMILILGLSPILAPTAGGFIISHYGWHTVFVLLAIICALILALVIFFLPESSGPDKNYSLALPKIVKKYWEVLHIKKYLAYTIMGSATSAALFSYLSGSPFVFMNLYAQSEKTYGYIFAIIAAGLIACSQLNSFLLKKYSSRQILGVMITTQCIIGIVFFIATWTNILNLYSTVTLISLFLSCQGFVFPNATAVSLEPFEKDAGSASAMGGSIQMGMAALAAGLVGAFHATTALPMAGVMLLFSLIGTVVYHFYQHSVSKVPETLV